MPPADLGVIDRRKRATRAPKFRTIDTAETDTYIPTPRAISHLVADATFSVLESKGKLLPS